MTEEAIFAGALEQSTRAERDAYLDSVCSGDAALRQRVEALLKSHDEAAGFLQTPAVQIAAEALAGRGHCADTQPRLFAENDTINLDFLAPAEDPHSLGRIGGYSVTEIIGRGGMGIVLKARDASLDRVVAIKVLAPELASNATARKRFLREARTAAAVTHQHIVTIHAVGEERLPYLVMECVSGQSLQDKLDQQGPLEQREVLRIGTQVALGLAAAHANGVIHRDIKPANILLENGIERVRITDFGLARAVDDVTMTRPGEVAGTPQYMSPEQAQGQLVDARSDLFSLGSVLYAMCTGRPPFRAETTIDAIRRVCDDTPRPIREVNADVPDWLTNIIDRLLAKRPEDRFQTAHEVAQLLGQHLAHVQDPASTPFPAVTRVHEPGSFWKPRLSRRWIVAATALCAVLAGVGMTEATGVTQFVATVLRIATSEGTLVVEVDDPSVNVTIEGDGGLTITGAGAQEVRLRPGSYRIQANKDGRPVALEQQLVAVTRGEKQIVRVRLEGASASTAATEVGTERGAFLLLGGRGVTDRKFDTLAAAVQGASEGDTIEIRGNGPFVIDPIQVNNALTIRSGAGCSPVLIAASREEYPSGNIILAFGPLRLEGLEIRGPTTAYRIVDARGPLWVANCRFVLDGGICIEGQAACVVQNSEIASRTGASLGLSCRSQETSVVTNSLLIGQVNLWEQDLTRGATLRFTGNTFVSPNCNTFLHLLSEQQARPTDALENRIHLSAVRNVFCCGSGPYGFVQEERPHPHLSVSDAEVWLRRRINWQEQDNCYQVKHGLWIQIRSEGQIEATSHDSLSDWNQFWGLTDTGSSEGIIRFSGGDLIAKALTDAPKLRLEDVRLRPDSAGYRTDPEGRDRGADVDLIGPGPAYERWKQTPDYQQWLEETEQKK